MLPSDRAIDDDVLRAHSLADSGLLAAVVRRARYASAGITHDLNSALQCLGDALFAIRQDAFQLVDEHSAGAPAVAAELASSLRLAEDAYDRINSAARAVPHLLPRLERLRNVSVGAELLDLVSLVQHDWRHRFNVRVLIDPPVGAITCDWWIARHVVLGLLAHLIERNTPSATRVPRGLAIIVSAADGILEIRMTIDTPEGVSSVTAFGEITDSADLASCARQLDAEIGEAIDAQGNQFLFLRLPASPPVALP
jgi:hypothetical protein